VSPDRLPHQPIRGSTYERPNLIRRSQLHDLVQFRRSIPYHNTVSILNLCWYWRMWWIQKLQTRIPLKILKFHRPTPCHLVRTKIFEQLEAIMNLTKFKKYSFEIFRVVKFAHWPFANLWKSSHRVSFSSHRSSHNIKRRAILGLLFFASVGTLTRLHWLGKKTLSFLCSFASVCSVNKKTLHVSFYDYLFL